MVVKMPPTGRGATRETHSVQARDGVGHGKAEIGTFSNGPEGYRLVYRMGYHFQNRQTQAIEIKRVFRLILKWLGDLDSNQD